jgi:hypothetical protein
MPWSTSRFVVRDFILRRRSSSSVSFPVAAGTKPTNNLTVTVLVGLVADDLLIPNRLSGAKTTEYICDFIYI